MVCVTQAHHSHFLITAFAGTGHWSESQICVWALYSSQFLSERYFHLTFISLKAENQYPGSQHMWVERLEGGTSPS